MNTQEKYLLVHAINIRLERLHTILDTNPCADLAGIQEPGSPVADDSELINLAKQERSDLLNSLEWVESAAAGMCDGCGEEIPLQRLLNTPTTRSCTACARDS